MRLLSILGEVAEWLKAPLSKSGIPFTRDRGFESHPLRHFSAPKCSKALMPGDCRLHFSIRCGEMSELAEGARLEIVCAVNSGTVGSNPTLSATYLL